MAPMLHLAPFLCQKKRYNMKYLTCLVAALITQSATGATKTSTEFNGSLQAGWAHNSALAVAELDDVSAEQDSGLMLKANINGKWQASEKTVVQGSYGYTSQNYSASDQYDLAIHLAAIDAAYSLSWFDVGVRHDAAFARLDGDSFLRFNQTSLYVAKLIAGNTFVRANSKFKSKKFANAQQRDADSVGAGVDVFYFLSSGDTMLTAGLNVEDESTIDPQFDFDGINVNTKLAHDFLLLGKDSQLSVAWRYQQRDYNQVQDQSQGDPLAMDENSLAREDNQHTYQLQWKIHLLPSLALKTEVELGDYRSTIEQQTYTQTVTSISIEANF
ncbi:MAG: hypothetical protein ACI9C4_000398 [Paraglaciecola sp.]|jgi:hypothetical protein